MEKRKNNKLLRAALVLGIVALFCASFVAGTFAKYVTTDDAMDTARAAKWGMQLSIGGSLFGVDYVSNTAASDPDALVAATANKVTLNASNSVHGTDNDGDTKDDNVVAPGTESDKGIIIDINGTPEVQYEVNATVADIEDIFLGAGNWGTMVLAEGVTAENFADGVYYTAATADGVTTYTVASVYAETLYELNDYVELTDVYRPLLWTITENGVAGTPATNLVDVAEALRADIDALEGNANAAIDARYELTWAWAFEGQNDEADTILGNLIAQDADAVAVIADGANFVSVTDDGTRCNLTVNFDIDVVVQQVN